MDDTINVSVDIEPTNAAVPLGIEVWLDGTKIYDNPAVHELTTVSHDFSDADAKHELQFVLKNKLPEHTKIDEQGNILSDALLEIKNINFDGIELGHMFLERTQYSHNFNGNGADVIESFSGFMGCNGTVTLKFTTPMYLWLLENM